MIILAIIITVAIISYLAAPRLLFRDDKTWRIDDE